MVTRVIKWELPHEGWFFFNTDGSVKDSQRIAGAVGLIRDDLGSWIRGYKSNHGSCGVDEA